MEAVFNKVFISNTHWSYRIAYFLQDSVPYQTKNSMNSYQKEEILVFKKSVGVSHDCNFLNQQHPNNLQFLYDRTNKQILINKKYTKWKEKNNYDPLMLILVKTKTGNIDQHVENLDPSCSCTFPLEEINNICGQTLSCFISCTATLCRITTRLYACLFVLVVRMCVCLCVYACFPKIYFTNVTFCSMCIFQKCTFKRHIFQKCIF